MNRSTFHAAGDRIVTVNSRKYDGHIRRSWTGGLVTQTDELIVLVGRFEDDVDHHDLGKIKKGTISFEHFWPGRWYNIFRFHEPDGALKAYYCNIAMPPDLADDVLDFVDLDIDVVVWPDMSYDVLDRDDFERNSVKYGYPDDVKAAVGSVVDDLVRMIERRQFPFEHQEQI